MIRLFMECVNIAVFAFLYGIHGGAASFTFGEQMAYFTGHFIVSDDVARRHAESDIEPVVRSGNERTGVLLPGFLFQNAVIGENLRRRIKGGRKRRLHAHCV